MYVSSSSFLGAGRSSEVAFAIYIWGGPIAISRSSQCSTTGVTKAVVCVILSVGWCI